MSDDQKCHLCKTVVPAADVSDFECAGCGKVICDAHPGDPWGNHAPEDHETDPFDDLEDG